MFTAPEIYGFMWSLHPARRNDDIYAALLANELPEIAKVPWPRTNRALSGPTEGAQNDLRAHYHEYTKWSSGPLYAELCRRIDAEWFEATGVFEPTAIESLAKLVGLSRERVGRLNDIWLWLAGFRSFVEGIEETGRKLVIEADFVDTPQEPRPRLGGLHRLGVLAAGRSSALNGALKTLRSYQRKRQLRRLLSEALRDYPPRKGDWENA
jgi:asparagine synthase (glutamine-hydrolysing)